MTNHSEYVSGGRGSASGETGHARLVDEERRQAAKNPPGLVVVSVCHRTRGGFVSFWFSSKRAGKMIRRDQPTQSSASSTTNSATLLVASGMDDGTAPPPPTVVRDFRSRSIDGPRRDSKERSSSSSNQSSSSSSTIYMPVGVNQIKEEASDPDIHVRTYSCYTHVIRDYAD